MNSVFNGKAHKLSSFKNVWISSCPDDSGLSIGAALYLYNNILQKKTRYELKHNFLGPNYSSDKIKKDLVLCDNWYDNDSEFICGVKNLLPNKPFLIGYGESVRCDDDIVLKKSNILQIWLPYSPNADQIELENNWGRRCNNPYPGPSNY